MRERSGKTRRLSRAMQEIVAICRTNTTVKPPYILGYKTLLPKMSINSNFKFRVCLVHRSKVELRSLVTAMVDERTSQSKKLGSLPRDSLTSDNAN